MVLRSCALLTPFRQGASHRRKVRNAFNNLETEQALAAPMKSTAQNEMCAVACIIFLKVK